MSCWQSSNKMAAIGVLVALVALLAVGLARAAPVKPDCKEDSEYFDKGPDCYKYIHCNKGAVEFKECPKDKFWNQSKGDCDLKENVSDCPAGRGSGELNEQSDENSEEVKVKPSEWRSPHGWCWGWAIPVQPVCTTCVVKQKPPRPPVRPPVRPPTRRPPTKRPPIRPPQTPVCATCVVPVQPVVPLVPVIQPTLVATPRITYEYRWVTGYHSGWYGRHYVAVPMKNGVQVTTGEQGEGATGEQGEGATGEQGEQGEGATGEHDEQGEQGEQGDPAAKPEGEPAAKPEGEQGDGQPGADQGDHAKGENDQTKAEGEQGDHGKAEGEQGDHSKAEGEQGDHSKENEQGEHSGEQGEQQPGELRQEAPKQKH